jgi:hypothetical protein
VVVFVADLEFKLGDASLQVKQVLLQVGLLGLKSGDLLLELGVHGRSYVAELHAIPHICDVDAHGCELGFGTRAVPCGGGPSAGAVEEICVRPPTAAMVGRVRFNGLSGAGGE